MLPTVRLLPGRDARAKTGHPWIFSNEVAMNHAVRSLPPGTAVRIEGDDGTRRGVWHFNPHSLMAARLLDRDPDAVPDAAWFEGRIGAALRLREKLFPTPHYRLAHAEADGLPGLILDRHGDVVALQANTAGMQAATPHILAALQNLIAPRSVVARNESPVRRLEGLDEHSRLLAGTDATAFVEEGRLRFELDLLNGQKTGWFHDQRENRARVAALCAGARVLDAFCHTGGFGLAAAAAGAEHVTLMDRSEAALELASRTAAAHGLTQVTIHRGEAMETLEKWHGEGRRFDVVVADPPAFAKARKDNPNALRAYSQLARFCAGMVNPGGFLFIASCSHHVSPGEFIDATAHGIYRARREGRLLFSGGAGADHPVHPMLPESAYLKGLLYAL